MNFVAKLLRKNTSPARIIGFTLSNFIGLAIILGGLQFYLDIRSIWEDDDSFIKTDYLVVNKKITSENTFAGASSSFSEEEIANIERQPWVASVGRFSSADYHVSASLNQGGRGMSTSMFFEAIPGEYVDVPASQWGYREGSDEVPIIISKDYLTLYNFGFASAAGLPQMSEGLMSGIPLTLRLNSEDGLRSMQLHGRVAGYSNRLNTILVPQEFLDLTNRELGTGAKRQPARLIIRTSSPGDVAIADYMESHNLEIAGDKSSSSASFLLKVIVGIILAIGLTITLLSFFILMLSISLLIEKNRDKLHSLLMLGYDLKAVAAPYNVIVAAACATALVLSVAGLLAMRAYYLPALAGLGAETASVLPALLTGMLLTAVIIILNIAAIRKKTKAAWRL